MDEQNPLPVNPSRKSRLGRRYSDHRRPDPAPSADPGAGEPHADALVEEADWTPRSDAEKAADFVALSEQSENESPPGWAEAVSPDDSTSALVEDTSPHDGEPASGEPDTSLSLADLRASPLHRRRRPRPEQGAKRWRLPAFSTSASLLALLAAAVAGALGYALGRRENSDRRSTPSAPAPDASRPATVPTLDPAVFARIEDAFTAFKAGRFADARTAFLAVRDRAPSLRTAGAWNEFFAGNFSQAESQVLGQIRDGIDAADAYFLLGLLRATRQDYPGAGQAFAAASALDPTRAETQFLWGDTLRRDGRPREAIAHFRAALRRNRQETNEGFYQYKLLLSQLEAGGEDAAEAEKDLPSNAESMTNASGFIQLTLAAQALGRGQPGVAAERLAAARKTLEPALFRIGLQDPIWATERERPELIEFFR